MITLFDEIRAAGGSKRVAVLVERRVAEALRTAKDGTVGHAGLNIYEHLEAYERVAELLGIAEWDKP